VSGVYKAKQAPGRKASVTKIDHPISLEKDSGSGKVETIVKI